MILELALRAARARLPSLLLQVVALAVALALAATVANLRSATRAQALPGAPCADRIAFLSALRGDGSWSDSFTSSQAVTLAGSLLHADAFRIASTMITIDDAGASRRVPASLIDEGVLGALCVRTEGGTVPRFESPGEVWSTKAARWRLPTLQAEGSTLRHSGVIDAFTGFDPSRPEYFYAAIADGAALRYDPVALNEPVLRVLIAPRPGRSMRDAQADVNRALAAMPGLMPDVQQLALVRNPALRGKSAANLVRMALLIAAIAAGLVALAIINTVLYYVGRQPEFAATSAVLRAIGARRRDLAKLATVEPALTAAAALWVAVFLAPLITRGAMLVAISDAAATRTTFGPSALGIAFAAAGAITLAIASARCALVLRTDKPNPLGQRRRAGAILPYLLASQTLFSLVVLAIGAQAALAYFSSMPTRVEYRHEGVTVLSVVGDNTRTQPNLLTRWRDLRMEGAFGRADAACCAFTENLLPVPYGFEPLVIRAAGTTSPSIDASANRVTPEFFEVLELPVVNGPSLSWSPELDGATREPKEVVINRLAASQLWPGGLPHEAAIEYDSLNTRRGQPWVRARVVGVVDEGSSGADIEGSDRALRAMVYLPFVKSELGLTSGFLIARDEGAPEAIRAKFANGAAELLPDARIVTAKPMTVYFNEVLAPERATAALLDLLAAGVAAVGALGLLAVILMQLVQSRDEQAIRYACGASLLDVRAALLRRVLAPIAVGVVLAIPIALVVGDQLGRVMEGAAAQSLVALGLSAAMVLVGSSAILLAQMRKVNARSMPTWLRAN